MIVRRCWHLQGASSLAVGVLLALSLGLASPAAHGQTRASSPEVAPSLGVTAWGNNSSGQSDVPAGLDDVVAISAGGEHSLALRSDGTVTAWGSNTFGQSDAPAGLDDVVAISAGGEHSLALRSDGTVTAWGSDGHGQTEVPAGLGDVVALDAGWAHGLALRSDGTVTAWGGNEAGQAQVPAGLDDVVAISAGDDHSLALRSDGTVITWGDGDGVGDAGVPAGLGRVVAIAAGTDHNLVLAEPPLPIGGVCPDPQDTPAFSDVSRYSVHVNAIDCAVSYEIARGYADGTYRPADGVRRDQMASFVVRTLEAAGHTLPAGDHDFTDIAGNAHDQAIGQLAAADIVRGRTPTSYAPARTVTRGQMASYLVRALDWAHDTTHTAPASPFTDITGSAHEQMIHTAYDLGLTVGHTATLYAPRTEVRRDQMASFLVRLLPQAMQDD
jgi:hypothetical protein